MIEVLWHGRGGQGAFTAARLLGAAASRADGRHALAFPSFGPERRGAPMRAFTKMSDAPIGDRSALAQADYVIYLDDTLLGDGWERELKPGGIVLVNSVRTFDDPRIVALDADGISSEVLGRPIPNTVFLGALAALCDQVSVEDVHEAIRQYMPAKLHAKNIAIVDAAMEAIANGPEQAPSALCHPEPSVAVAPSCHSERSAQREVEGSRAATAGTPPVDTTGDPSTPHLRCSAQDDKGEGVGVRRALHISTLRADGAASLDPRDFAHSTCFEGGFLVAKNAGWRNIRPVIDAAACTGCLQCYMHCPDGTVFKTDGAAPVAIDLDFCKGCGICAKVCKFGAIAMVPERGESEASA